MRHGRRLIALAVAVAIAVSLSACDPYRNLQGPVALRIIDGEVQLAVCTDIEVGLVYAVIEGEGGASAEWEAIGRASFVSGEVITEESLRAMYEHANIEPTPASVESVSVLLQRPNEINNVAVAFPVEGTPSSPDAWLQSDGRWTTQKCP